MANPASENCIKQGGTLSIQERGDGGQYGICLFEDNRQCEEWALLRGDCPVGGLKVTGYITPAAQYCVITGGTYAITGQSNTDMNRAPAPSRTVRSMRCLGLLQRQVHPRKCHGRRVANFHQHGSRLQPAGAAYLEPASAARPERRRLHGMAFSGPEGGVEVYWGTGFGGACTTGTEPVQLAQAEVAACHATQQRRYRGLEPDRLPGERRQLLLGPRLHQRRPAIQP